MLRRLRSPAAAPVPGARDREAPGGATKELHALLARDHDRLDGLLERCLREDDSVDAEAYGELRQGLLRHIAIEEKVLFPLLRKRRGPSGLESQLHRDHAALASLLVPPPTAVEIGRVRALLALHNPLEEVAGGLYEAVEEVAAADLPALMEKVRAIPPVRLAPHADTPLVRASIEMLVRAAETDRLKIERGP